MFNLVEILSNLLTIFYAYRAVQLAVQIYRQWADLLAPPLTRYKKQIAEQASFFIAVPPGVFIHELGHALAVWAFGGQVVEFAYRVFWGYVRPDRIFPNPQEWFISLAGTLGSLLFGLILWLVLRQHRATSIRYFALRAFRFQVYFSLIYYPLFSFILPIGDWLTIYDFAATPILSGATAVFHVALLLLFWLAERDGRFEAPSHSSEAAAANFDQLVQKAKDFPEDSNTQLAYIEQLIRGGAKRSAHSALKQFLANHPESGVGHLQLAILQSESQQEVSLKAKKTAEKAVALGLPERRQMAIAQQIIGRFYLVNGQGQLAGEALSKALTAVSPYPDHITDPRLYAHLLHLRSQAHRREQTYDKAFFDLDKAIDIARQAKLEKAVEFYQRERETLVTIAKRPLS